MSSGAKARPTRCASASCKWRIADATGTRTLESPTVAPVFRPGPASSCRSRYPWVTAERRWSGSDFIKYGQWRYQRVEALSLGPLGNRLASVGDDAFRAARPVLKTSTPTGAGKRLYPDQAGNRIGG